MKEYIICSAVIFNGHYVCGRRHSDCYATIKALTGKPLSELKHLLPKSNLENGFMTSKGRFVTRKEAWIIAEENKQIAIGYEACTGEDAILISENLY